ncbi:MAG TPA: GlsB/YeaQ/YmgE family stress response membrane protein [Thermoleophilaceae bacterium]
MIGALILGLVAGFVGRALMPGRGVSGLGPTLLLGLGGAALGWVIFTLGLGIGDDDAFDLGGLVGAVIGTMLLLGAYGWLKRA